MSSLPVDGGSPSRRILLITSGWKGLLYSAVELARRLAAGGHQITLAAPSEARRLAEHHGLDFLELPGGSYDEFLQEDAERGWLPRLLELDRRRREATTALAVEELVTAVTARKPDLLLIDGELHEVVMALAASGTPLALLNTFVSIWRCPGLPPPHCLVRPGVGWQGSRMGMWLLWRALRWRKRTRALRQWIRHAGCDRRSLLRYLAKREGLDFGVETDDTQWLIPFTFRRFPTLSLHAEEFEFPHAVPERVRYTGPLVLYDRLDDDASPAQTAELERVLEWRRSTAHGRLIYAGFGSVFTAELELVQRLAAVVGEHPDWRLVLSLGRQLSLEALGELPDGVRAFPWVPQLRVLQHADVMVTHGGVNSVEEGVIEGVPMLIYCGHETDMAGSTARAVHHGIAIAGDRRQDGEGDIRRHLETLMTESSYTDSVRRLRDLYRRYSEEQVAERLVAALLEEPVGPGVERRRSSRG